MSDITLRDPFDRHRLAQPVHTRSHDLHGSLGAASTGDSTESLVYVANRLPWPLDDGWKRRTFAVLDGLSACFDVHLVAPRPDASVDLEAFRRAVGSRVRVVLPNAGPPLSAVRTAARSLFSSDSPLSIRHYSATLERAVVSTVEDVQPRAVVYAGAFLAERHARSAIASVPFIIDTHNIDSHAMARRAPSEALLPSIATRLVSRRLRSAEAQVFAEARAVLVCSSAEVPLVRERAAASTVFVVPNGVDTTVFLSAPPRVRTDRLELLFFGNLDYPPNVDAMQYFAKDIYPALRERGVRFRLKVVGAGRAERVRDAIASLESVELVGLSDNIVQTLHDSDAVIVPLRAGGGTRLKVLEALSSARPVISTRIGAEGIEVVDRTHILFAESPSDFAQTLTAVSADPAKAYEIAEAGARLARSSYSWQAIQAVLCDIIRECTTPAGDVLRA